ncbi:MAG: hypothetical protein VX949_00680 [Planctomycetota bacterium]|nr:hypothetical protein [Planctomycetota bacterium]
MSKINLFLIVVLLTAPASLSAQSASLSIIGGEGFRGDVVSASILLTTTADLHGFSIGVSHDPLVVSIETTAGIRQGATLQALNLGSGPTFFNVNIAPANGTGFTVACVTDLFAPFEQIPVVTDDPVLEVDYLIDIGATVGAVTPIDFSDLLGSPPVDTVMVFELLEVVPSQTGGSVTVTEPHFLRGDLNQNGSLSLLDGVLLLYRVAGLEIAGSCRDADDINDDGLLTIGDAVYLFQYLYVGGAAVPSPFGICGPDPGAEDGLDCIEHNACP